MNLKEYGEIILLSTLGIPKFYIKYIQEYIKLELIAKYLKGDLVEQTAQNPLIPKVNEIMEEIEEKLYQNLPNNLPYVKKWYWPNWKDYALSISHDVDKISESKKHIWKIRKRFSKLTVLKALLGISNPYKNFKLYAKLEKQYNVRSSFYFLTDEYKLKKISKDLKLLQKNHSELALHGGFGSHIDSTQLKNEKEKLEEFIGEFIYGIRHHFLKFEFPTTWEVQNKVNFLYDTTIGFNDKIGFKNSIAFPFFSLDHDLNLLPIIEIPLIIMDAVAWTWLKLTEDNVLETILKVRDIIKQHHGLLTLLWHQCTLKMRGGRLYPNILKKLIENSAYIASGVEIAHWWYARNEFKISIIPKKAEILINFQNSQNIQNMGLLIKGKQMEIISKTPNIKIIEKLDSGYKLTFTSGDSGEIRIKRI
ncbi:MAG: hypothetical protein ACFFD2_26255 [Promethearchaeota archaeon]